MLNDTPSGHEPAIVRERLDEPIKRERLDKATVERLRRETAYPKPRGPNKAHLITDIRRLISRRELADICRVSVDTVKKWEAKTPGDVGLTPVRLSPNGRTVFYIIEDAERFLGITLRRH